MVSTALVAASAASDQPLKAIIKIEFSLDIFSKNLNTYKIMVSFLNISILSLFLLKF